jgi:hypothetical protein
MQLSVQSSQFIRNIIFSFIILGCVETYAQPDETKSVTIMVGEEGPVGCELLGKVKGSSKDSEAGEDHTPYLERLIKARNNLRNEARKLGGNNVHIIRSNNSGKYEIPGADKEIIFIGNVYHCQ